MGKASGSSWFSFHPAIKAAMKTTNTKQKPILRLLSCDASLAQAQQFIEEMTGEKMTPEGIEELRQIWENPTPPS
jgi:hypothetical protein